MCEEQSRKKVKKIKDDGKRIYSSRIFINIQNNGLSDLNQTFFFFFFFFSFLFNFFFVFLFFFSFLYIFSVSSSSSSTSSSYLCARENIIVYMYEWDNFLSKICSLVVASFLLRTSKALFEKY